MANRIKSHITNTATKARRYSIIASVSLNVMVAIVILGYATLAGRGYVPLPSFSPPAVSEDMQTYNVAKAALKIADSSIQPAKVYQASAAPMPGRKPTNIPAKVQ